MKRLFVELFNLVYPPSCLVCKTLLRENSYLCDRCFSQIKFITASTYCQRCFYPLNSIEKEVVPLCGNCRNDKYLFKRNYSIAVFDGVFKEMIHLFKYQDKELLSVFFSRLMVDFITKYLEETVDLVSFVPLYRARERARGYNQAYLLANSIRKSFQIPLAKNILVRVKANRPQTNLSREQRRKNVKDVFKAKNVWRVKNKRILLIDDVFTTGATLNECSKVLVGNGAKEVVALTLARARGS